MAAIKKTKRNKTAKELAHMLGIHERTVRKYIAQPRKDYEKEAEDKRKIAFQLRSSGLKWKEVAEIMNTTEYSAIAYYRRYLALQRQESQ